jgi:hypothetical protein
VLLRYEYEYEYEYDDAIVDATAVISPDDDIQRDNVDTRARRGRWTAGVPETRVRLDENVPINRAAAIWMVRTTRPTNDDERRRWIFLVIVRCSFLFVGVVVVVVFAVYLCIFLSRFGSRGWC